MRLFGWDITGYVGLGCRTGWCRDSAGFSATVLGVTLIVRRADLYVPTEPDPPRGELPMRGKYVNAMAHRGREHVEFVKSERERRLAQLVASDAPERLQQQQRLLIREAEEALRVLEQGQRV